jgi:hypothetical protein
MIRRQSKALYSLPRRSGSKAFFLSLQGGSEQDETEFKEEIQRRRQAFKSGEMPARPFEEILRKRLGK